VALATTLVCARRGDVTFAAVEGTGDDSGKDGCSNRNNGGGLSVEVAVRLAVGRAVSVGRCKAEADRDSTCVADADCIAERVTVGSTLELCEGVPDVETESVELCQN